MLAHRLRRWANIIPMRWSNVPCLEPTVCDSQRAFDRVDQSLQSRPGRQAANMEEKSMDGKLDELNTKVDRLSGHFAAYMNNNGMQPIPLNQKKLENDEVDEFTTDFSRDENEDRGNWTGRMDFLLACLGYAVGLGNVWRFPYLCYKNGGAVFFIPYVIMLVFVGIPIFLLELSIGQFTSSGPLTCWGLAPVFKGIGVGMVIVSGLVGIYYNMIIAWSLYYLFASFTSDLPWEYCHIDWAGPYCADYMHELKGAAECRLLGHNATSDGVCRYTVASTPDNFTDVYPEGTVYGFWNRTLAKENDLNIRLPTEDYLERSVWHKHESDGLGDLGDLQWKLVLAYLGAWIIVFLSLCKGVKSSGKVVYFTALFPYVVLVILLIRAVTLDGHKEGVSFYIEKIKWEKLEDAQVWKEAAVQIFFSLSASWGGLITLASYNRFHTDCVRDTLIVAIGNCLTSFFAGFVIFSFLGFLAKETGQTVEDVVQSGIGLAFTVYPAAVVKMPVSPLWAILFFLMLITLGLDSEFALVETVTTSIFDQWPQTRKRKWQVILVVSIIGFVLGLTMCTSGGSYMLQLMDNYAGGWNVLLIAFLECICVAYVYGYCRYKEDIRCMVGDHPCGCVPWNACMPWWAICWYFATPCGVLFIMIFSWVDYEGQTWDTYSYPEWGDALGWLMTLAVVVGIVATSLGMVIYNVCMQGMPWSSLVTPSAEWGPALPKHRRLMGRYLRDDQYILDPTSMHDTLRVDDIGMEESMSARF